MITKKRKIKKYSLQEKALMGLLMVLDILIVGFLVFGNLKLYAENKQINRQYLDLNRELEYLEKRNQELKQLFSMAASEEYSERLLREKGMYKKSGEEVVVITRNEFPQEGALSLGEQTAKTASFWDKIADFFKHIFGRD